MILFDVELKVLDKFISVNNIPGCMSFGNTSLEAYKNIINTIIECVDARIINNIDPVSDIQPIDPGYDGNYSGFTPTRITHELESYGWSLKYIGVNNDVLIKDGSSITFTIPRNEILENIMIINIRKYQYLQEKM